MGKAFDPASDCVTPNESTDRKGAAAARPRFGEPPQEILSRGSPALSDKNSVPVGLTLAAVLSPFQTRGSDDEARQPNTTRCLMSNFAGIQRFTGSLLKQHPNRASLARKRRGGVPLWVRDSRLVERGFSWAGRNLSSAPRSKGRRIPTFRSLFLLSWKMVT